MKNINNRFRMVARTKWSPLSFPGVYDQLRNVPKTMLALIKTLL